MAQNRFGRLREVAVGATLTGLGIVRASPASETTLPGGGQSDISGALRDGGSETFYF